MKPFFASVVLVLLGLQSTLPLFADTGDTRANTVHSEPTALRDDRPTEAPSIAVTPVLTTSSGSTGSLIEYPVGPDFVRLRSIIESKFVPGEKKNNEYSSYSYNCILGLQLCPSYRYTSIDEKAIKLIILKTYESNKGFYSYLFAGKTDNYAYPRTREYSNGIDNILTGVPHGATALSFSLLDFGSNLGGDLLESSFGLNFSENNTSGMLGVIDQKIKEIRRQNCQNANLGSDSYSICPWSGEISNTYLPTPEELMQQTVYLNSQPVRIVSLKDEFIYSISGAVSEPSSRLSENYSKRQLIDEYDSAVITEKKNELSQSGAVGEQYLSGYTSYYIDPVRKVRKNPTISSARNAMKFLDYQNERSENETKLIELLREELQYYIDVLTKRGDGITYSLKYTKDSYTLQEAKDEIEKKPSMNSDGPFLSSSNYNYISRNLPCTGNGGYIVQSECVAARSNAMDISTTLGAYFADKEKYPDSIDQLDRNYLPKEETLINFKKNFEYKNTTTPGIPMYEIKYIGHIGEGATDSGATTDMKKDYRALMSGATVPAIPAIFQHVPSDSMVLYVKSPADLFDILNQKSNTTTRLSGLDVSETVKDFLKNFLELQNFDQIQTHLQHEMAVVVNNLDLTAPDMVIILSEADREALSSTAKARVVGSKNGYIYIANSKESLDHVMNISREKSLEKSPDFQYVWWKKSGVLRDALFFVGDAFFEKMLTFETYITHYRKYRDVKRLSALQELVWAYEDAFGTAPKTLTDLESVGLSTLTGTILSDYAIDVDLVQEKHVGSLRSLKTLPEANYDLSNISRQEIEDYKVNVLKYRDTWRASLDPMGIVLNRYGDGIQVDFFMTPIPSFGGSSDMQFYQKFFQGVSKNSLSFITNPHIRMGLVSFVYGFDPKKLQSQLEGAQDLKQSLKEFNNEVVTGGTNVLDYLGGEFGFSLGGLDPDIFEGWNIEKVDLFFSIQVASEEKGKDLIEMIRKKFIDSLGRSEDMKTLGNFLAKPLIEDYGNKKIYYSEKIPVPFVGEISFAYTFIDDFFVFGLNRPTIRHVIDVANAGDAGKKRLLDEHTLPSGTFFSLLFDGEGMSQAIQSLYEKNVKTLPRYMKSLVTEQTSLTSLLSEYVVSYEKAKRLSETPPAFDHTLGALKVHGSDGNVVLSLDDRAMSTLSGTALELWGTLKNDPNFPKELLTGIDADRFLSYSGFSDVLSLSIILQLQNTFHASESLLRNVVFGMNFGNDELGFTLRIFRDKDFIPPRESSPSSSGIGLFSSPIVLWGSVGGIGILILIGGIFIIMRRRKGTSGGISPSPNIPAVSITSEDGLIQQMNPAQQVVNLSGSVIVPPNPPLMAPTSVGENITPISSVSEGTLIASVVPPIVTIERPLTVEDVPLSIPQVITSPEGDTISTLPSQSFLTPSISGITGPSGEITPQSIPTPPSAAPVNPFGPLPPSSPPSAGSQG